MTRTTTTRPSLLGPIANVGFTTAPGSHWPPTDLERVVVPLSATHALTGSSRLISRVTDADVLLGAAADEPMKVRTLPVEPDRPVVEVFRLADPPDPGAAGALIGRSARPGATLDILSPRLNRDGLRAFTRGLVIGAHTTRRPDAPPALRLWVETAEQGTTADRAAIIARRTLLARDLGNEPSNRKDPTWLAAQAAAVAGGRLTVRTLGTERLEREGFGGLVAVGRGSETPPNLTIMTYEGSRASPHVVLVGKGITFDSGGLSLKPPTAMPLMKTDMTGAAAVLATLATARDLDLPVSVTGVIACAENMPSGSAMRPGDVVRHYGGRTTEVLNTDAEGRLVLADALAFASRTLRPHYLVDIASLTGAATLGLGRQHAALYSRDDRLARALVRSGQASGDAVWRLPLVDDYAEAIASDIADAANTNTDAFISAGSITAALFLEPFATAGRWAHLDIAGASRTESDRDDCRKGATGFGVSLLVDWLARL